MLRGACLEDPQILAPLGALSAELQVAAIEGDYFGIASLDTPIPSHPLAADRERDPSRHVGAAGRQLTIIFGLATLQNDMMTIAQEHVILTDLIRSGDKTALERNLQLHILDSPQAIDFAALIARRNAPSKKPQRRRV